MEQRKVKRNDLRKLGLLLHKNVKVLLCLVSYCFVALCCFNVFCILRSMTSVSFTCCYPEMKPKQLTTNRSCYDEKSKPK